MASKYNWYVEVDFRDGSVSVDQEHESCANSTPFYIYHGHADRFYLNSEPCDPEGISEAVKAIFEEAGVFADYESVWDGHNHVAKFEDQEAFEKAAQAAQDYVDQLGEGDLFEEHDAADYFGALGGLARQARDLGITAQTSDEEMDALEEKENTSALSENKSVEGLRDHLDMLRNFVREQDEDAA